MRNALILAKKDARGYLFSWMGVFVFTLFFLLSGLFFFFLLLSYSKISIEASRNLYQGIEGIGLTRFIYGSYFMNMGALLVFFVPLLTMRAFAEERRLQTLELLFTYPFSDFDIVWGKFLGMVWFFELLMIPTLLYAGSVYWLGGQLDWGPVITGYIGFWLIGNAYLALGLFVSAVSESQVVSAMITFAALIIFWIVDWVSSVADGAWAHFFSLLSPLTHYREFTLGILDLNHLVYFVFFYFYFIFLTLRAIETRNWKG